MEIELRLFIAWGGEGGRLDPQWYEPLLRPWTSFTMTGTVEIHVRTQGRYMDEWPDILVNLSASHARSFQRCGCRS